MLSVSIFLLELMATICILCIMGAATINLLAYLDYQITKWRVYAQRGEDKIKELKEGTDASKEA